MYERTSIDRKKERKDKYILKRIGLYFWGFWEKLDYF